MFICFFTFILVMVTGILLGRGISPRGKLSYGGRKRAKKALQLFKQKKVDRIILSGGHTSHKNPELSEAGLFSDYLIKKGVPRQKLFLEESSLETIGNAVFSKKVLLKRQFGKNILVITSDYHLPRSLFIFKHVFGPLYQIDGASCRTLISKLRHKSKEFVSWKIDEQLLRKIPVGDHRQAEKAIKKYIPMYGE